MSLVSVSEASQNLSHWINQASYGRECVFVTIVGAFDCMTAAGFVETYLQSR